MGPDERRRDRHRVVMSLTTPRTTVPSVSRRADALTSSAIRDILEHARKPGVISLAGGIPDPALFPIDAVKAATIAALDIVGPAALQYGPTLGEPWFREWAAASTNTAVDAASVVATAGSQQAIDLLAWTLVDPGDQVAVGDPDYLGTLQAMERNGATLLPVRVDHDGLDTEQLANLLRAGQRPRACTLVAAFGNPTGATLSPDRRTHLVELAEHYGFWIIEDDPYGRLSFDGPEPPAIGQGSDRVIRVRTISKVLAPGLRLGWLCAPPAVVAAVERTKQAADLHTSTLAQAIVTHLEVPVGHLERLVNTYRERRDALVAAIDSHLPAADHRPPAGGMFCWLDLGSGVDTTALLPAALAAGVAFVPGAAFSPTRGSSTALRLTFATAGPDALDEGVARLASVLPAIAKDAV